MFVCPLYYAQCLKLVNDVAAITRFYLDKLLYGDDSLDYEANCKLFKAADEFICDSGRL